MPEVTLQAIEQLLEKQTKTLTGKIEDSGDELAEMIQFLTKVAAHKDDLKDQTDHFNNKFAEQAVTLNFIESQLATLRKDLEQLARRTKEDDGAFVKDILKLKNRMDQFEKQLKKLRVVHV